MTELPLRGRRALVTGASRRQGIGFAVARRLVAHGADVCVHHHRPHDERQPWGPDDLGQVLAELRAAAADGATVADVAGDLADPDRPRIVVEQAAQALGGLDVLVCNQARSGGDGPLRDLTAEQIDGHFAVDARATLLLTQAFAARFGRGDPARPSGRVVWLTSGQQQGPMRDEVAYATAKAALAGVTATVADELIDAGIVLNTVNPGPVNTGYLSVETTDRDPALLEQAVRGFPGGRFGEPDDPARLIAWLVGDDARWVVGQVLNTEGGFRRA